MLRQLALVGVVLALMGVVGLPFSAWRKFKLETRFGFNRIPPRLFVLDTLKTLIVTLILGIPLAASALRIMGNTGPNWVWWAWGTLDLFNFLILWQIGRASCRERVCKDVYISVSAVTIK